MRQFVWEPVARADLRRLDRDTAMRMLHALTRYGRTGEGDVKQLHGRDNEFRLRAGDYRICFTPEGDLLHIHWVSHRSEAYRLR